MEKRFGIREIAKAQREASAAAKDWTAANPRKQGESKAAYQKRAKAGIGDSLQRAGASTDWLALIFKLLEMLLPLFIK